LNSLDSLSLAPQAYIYLSVALCQILKALTPGVTLLMAYALGTEKPNSVILGCVLVICIGTALAAQVRTYRYLDI